MTPSTTRLAYIILLFYVPLAHAQQASSEAARISKQVFAKTAWAAEAEKCPISLMAKREIPGSRGSNSCTGTQLGSCLEKCESGNARACYWLAYQLQKSGDETQAPDFLYQRACKLGIFSGCTNRAAGMLVRTRDDPAVQRCTAGTFAKVCPLDDQWACTMYAFQLTRGMGVPQNKPLALEVLKKSCKYGPEDEACRFAKGLEAEITGDKKKSTPPKP